MNRAMRRSLPTPTLLTPQKFAWIAALVRRAVCSAPSLRNRAAAQGGEPQSFAIRGATIVPVSGPRIENGTVIVVARRDHRRRQRRELPAGNLGDRRQRTDRLSRPDRFLHRRRFRFAAGAEGARSSAPPSRGPEDRPASTPWRDAAGEATLSDKRIETWRDGGFTTVISAHKGGIFPGQAALLDLGGERNGDLVVKSPVAIPVSLQPPGSFASFPGSLMGTLGYVHQVWLDTEWSGRAESIYDKNPKGMARPRYDRTDSALADALEDHARGSDSGEHHDSDSPFV